MSGPAGDRRRPVVVLGSGRSGTSMVAGCLHGGGWHLGEDLIAATPANPRGYFESRTIESINESLLQTLFPPRSARWPWRWIDRHVRGRLGPAQRWLAPVPPDARIEADGPTLERMRSALPPAPWAMKDPRFCFTLEAWRPVLPAATVFVVVFRQPERTIRSILRELDEEPYLADRSLDARAVEAQWRRCYEAVLDRHRPADPEGRWLLLHYDQVVEGPGLDRLEAHVGGSVDRSMPRASLSRTGAAGDRGSAADLDPATIELYHRLCAEAGWPSR